MIELVCELFIAAAMTGTPPLPVQDTFPADPLRLMEVVVTDRTEQDKLFTPVSVHSRGGEDVPMFQGTAASMNGIPGQFVDASTGEVFTRVHTRGISLSAEDDIGWYYTSLQEDGLPVTTVQYNQFSPDFFFRPDVSVRRVEAMRGGKSAVLASNSPGGIVNYTTDRIDQTYSSYDRLSFGLYESGRFIGRVEGRSGGPIGQQGWHHGFSYLYRYDEGPRNLDYTMNEGGQFKASIHKLFTKGLFSFKLKYLNDKVNRYTGLAATGWRDPVAAFGQDFSTTSLLPPSLTAELPDGRNNGSSAYNYNTDDGIRAKDLSFQADFDLRLGPWTMQSKTKYSKKQLDWQTAIGGQPLGLDNFLTYFISGDPFPVGLVEFRDAGSGNPIATVDNSGILAAFQGLPGSFDYIQGALPFDAVMGTGAWKKDDSIDEFIQDLQFDRNLGKTRLQVGLFNAFASLRVFTNASFLYSTYEPDPRLLSVILANPGEPERKLSDANGLSNYGALFYQTADVDLSQNALYAQASIELSPSTLLDLGSRLERIGHKGSKDRFAPIDKMGGFDGDLLTSYDAGALAASGKDDFDFSYTFLSYSVGINHALEDHMSIYTRYSNGNKAPEMNYYINNFSNVEIPGKGIVQNVEQFESGLKYLGQGMSLSLSAFYSHLDNVPFSEFVFDADNNRVFYSPTLFNATETIGLEIETEWMLSDRWNLSYDLTLQKGSLQDYQLYLTQGTTSTDDDGRIDFSGNVLPHTPSYMHTASVSYTAVTADIQLRWHVMGARYGNVENSFEMSGFGTLDLSGRIRFGTRWEVSLDVLNALNSSGIINFFGPNEFGSNANQATADFISSNPDASFVVFPIHPRAIYLGLGFRFSK